MISELTKLIKAVSVGERPCVQVTESSFSDMYLNQNMLAEVVGIKEFEHFFEISLDFNRFEQFNRQFALKTYFDSNDNGGFTAEEVGLRPLDGIDVLTVYKDESEFDLPLSIVSSKKLGVFQEYMQSADMSSVLFSDWLLEAYMSKNS